LAVLIQQNLIYHCNDQLDDRTYYEANHDAAYALVRTGKIVELVTSRFGVLAREIMQNILLLGHAKVSDIADAIRTPNKPHTNSDTKGHTGTNSVNGINGINGKPKALVPAVGQLDHILAQLLQSGFIEPVTEQMFRSPTDAYNIVEKKLLHDNYAGQTKGTRQKEELKEKVRGQLKSLRDEGRSWKSAGNKRPGDLVNGVTEQGKKRRHSRSEAPVNGAHAVQDEGFRLDVGF
jgi:DNA-directed RNA polymerase III subunit RPC3